MVVGSSSSSTDDDDATKPGLDRARVGKHQEGGSVGKGMGEMGEREAFALMYLGSLS